jgi:hypothetical protein
MCTTDPPTHLPHTPSSHVCANSRTWLFPAKRAKRTKIPTSLHGPCCSGGMRRSTGGGSRHPRSPRTHRSWGRLGFLVLQPAYAQTPLHVSTRFCFAGPRKPRCCCFVIYDDPPDVSTWCAYVFYFFQIYFHGDLPR